MTRVQQSGTGGPGWRRLWLNGLVWSVLVWSGTGLHTAAAQDPGTPRDEKRTEWFRNDKFGMFIHWGIYSVPAGEWKDRKDHAEWIMLTGNIPSAEYEKFATGFNPVKVNGGSIYDTTASPFAKTPWGRCTAKSGKLYLHVFEWPSDGKLMVAGLKNQVNKAYLLAARDKPCAVTAGNEQVTIAVPPEMPDKIDTVVVLEIQGDPQVSQAQ